MHALVRLTIVALSHEMLRWRLQALRCQSSMHDAAPPTEHMGADYELEYWSRSLLHVRGSALTSFNLLLRILRNLVWKAKEADTYSWPHSDTPQVLVQRGTTHGLPSCCNEKCVISHTLVNVAEAQKAIECRLSCPRCLYCHLKSWYLQSSPTSAKPSREHYSHNVVACKLLVSVST